MIVSSRKLIKSQNLIRVRSTNIFITNEERDFLIGIFDKYFNGMHKNTPMTEERLYCIMFDIDRFYENIQFDKDFYIFKDRPVNDIYYTYGFKIIKSLDSAFDIIRYILTYISEYYGLPNDKLDSPYQIKITEQDSIIIIGV